MGSLKERQASFNGKPKENRHFGAPKKRTTPHQPESLREFDRIRLHEFGCLRFLLLALFVHRGKRPRSRVESFGFAGTFSSECAKRGSSCPKIKISGPNTSKIKWQPVKTRKLGKQPFRSSVTTIKTMVGGSISPPLFTFQDCHHLHWVFAIPFMEARNSNLLTSLTRLFHQSHLAGLS